MRYTAVIRTLGKAGNKYQKLLDSLKAQTYEPSEIVVYLAEGHGIPKETIGKEKIIFVPKGMVAQRALHYDEVNTEWILCLDDDVELSPDAVEKLYNQLKVNGGDVIAPSLFHNHLRPLLTKIRLTLFGKEVCRPWKSKWAYKALPTGGFSYNNNPKETVYHTELNGGPCFLCRKKDLLKINFEDELWLDQTPYAFPEDQVMYYKMYCKGLSILTSFDCGIIHLDACTSNQAPDRIERIIYSEYRNKLIFWHRFLYLPAPALKRIWYISCISFSYGLQFFNSSLKILLGHKEGKAFFRGVKDAISFIKSDDYKLLPLI